MSMLEWQKDIVTKDIVKVINKGYSMYENHLSRPFDSLEHTEVTSYPHQEQGQR